MERSPHNVMYSFTSESLYWPLLIVARLLLAAVQSHHSVAFTPHILAYDPLSGVAGTSPKKGYSFFQLHPVEIKRHVSDFVWRHKPQSFSSVTEKVLISVAMVFFFFLSSDTLSRWFPTLSCLQKGVPAVVWVLITLFCFPGEKLAILHVFSSVFLHLIMSSKHRKHLQFEFTISASYPLW